MHLSQLHFRSKYKKGQNNTLVTFATSWRPNGPKGYSCQWFGAISCCKADRLPIHWLVWLMLLIFNCLDIFNETFLFVRKNKVVLLEHFDIEPNFPQVGWSSEGENIYRNSCTTKFLIYVFVYNYGQCWLWCYLYHNSLQHLHSMYEPLLFHLVNMDCKCPWHFLTLPFIRWIRKNCIT